MNTRDVLAADLYGKGWRNNKRNEEIAKGNQMFTLANAFGQNVYPKECFTKDCKQNKLCNRCFNEERLKMSNKEYKIKLFKKTISSHLCDFDWKTCKACRKRSHCPKKVKPRDKL